MIQHTVTGCGHGQIDCLSTWMENGEAQGYVSYAVFEDTPHIQNIKVNGSHLRRGIATALVRDLQERYPEREIDWGMLTEDGSAFYNQLPFIEVPSEHARDFDKLARLQKRFDALIAKAQSQNKKDSFATYTAAWCLELHIDALKDELFFEKPTKRLIDLSALKKAA
jgi:hypothetical protein